jgi:hypothetical protein
VAEPIPIPLSDIFKDIFKDFPMKGNPVRPETVSRPVRITLSVKQLWQLLAGKTLSYKTSVGINIEVRSTNGV